MTTEVREARLEDCKFLVERMDDAGRNFIRKHWDVEPLSGLIASFETSALCWSVLVDGQVAGMFGCTRPDGESGGQAWLTTAPDIDRARLRFIRQSGPYIQKMLDECGGSLFALAHRDNARLLAWLKWSGFEPVARQGEFEICVCRSR